MWMRLILFMGEHRTLKKKGLRRKEDSSVFTPCVSTAP